MYLVSDTAFNKSSPEDGGTSIQSKVGGIHTHMKQRSRNIHASRKDETQKTIS